MKTAVEWLEEQIEMIEFNSPEAQDFYDEVTELIKVAKQFEKRQIKEAFRESRKTHPMIGFKHDTATDYNNETFDK